DVRGRVEEAHAAAAEFAEDLIAGHHRNGGGALDGTNGAALSEEAFRIAHHRVRRRLDGRGRVGEGRGDGGWVVGGRGRRQPGDRVQHRQPGGTVGEEGLQVHG